MQGSDSDLASFSSHKPKNRSPKVVDRKPTQSPNSKNKRPNRVAELESLISRLQEELKSVRGQLNLSESSKRRAQLEAEEAKGQLLVMAAKFQESQQHLLELSASEEGRIRELCKISQERDKAWQSELEAVQKQYSLDSAVLGNAMNEIQRLKLRLEMVTESEANHRNHADSSLAEIQELRAELAEALSMVDGLKAQLRDAEESEALALDVARKKEMQLKTANATMEMLKLDETKTTKKSNSLLMELKESKEQVRSLEKLISECQADLADETSRNLDYHQAGNNRNDNQNAENGEINHLKAELNHVRSEMDGLRSSLEAAETRYREEYIKSMVEIRGVYEQEERIKSESIQREAELQAELRKTKAQTEMLRADIMQKESQLRSISEENENLNSRTEKEVLGDKESDYANELKKLKAETEELKASLLDRETELQCIAEENQMLKMEIETGETERCKTEEETADLKESAITYEQDGFIFKTEEVDKSSGKVISVSKQPGTADPDVEAQLRRLKVQSEQWRKAAETAAAMLSMGGDGQFVKTGALYISSPFGSPSSEDLDDGSLKKKNMNMFKKIGVLWKKGQK